MLFNSLEFLLFFPVVTLLYFAVPKRFKTVWLLISSYFFYMCWNVKYALLMAVSTVITYASGLLISRADKLSDEARRKHARKACVFLSFAGNLVILVGFKYANFLLDIVKAAGERLNILITVPAFDILLPVGISFYTFQALSYTMDVYRGDVKVEKNIIKYALFVSFFPQLVAGPIERSKDLLSQMGEEHHMDYNRMKNGLLRMLWGYFQKIVISERLSVIVTEIYGNYHQYPGLYILFGTTAFAFQVYCDFGGYSNIAIGAAQVMGFRLTENFHQPYLADGMQDFWRRWHISLTNWFREYLYIPLGGNRKGRFRQKLNIMIVFLVSGLWHGANWTYVVWGGLHGIYQIIDIWLKPLKKWKAAKPVRIMITFLAADFAWIFFRAESIAHARQLIGGLFSKFNPEILWDGSLWKLGLNNASMYMLIAGMAILIFVDILQEYLSARPVYSRCDVPGIAMWVERRCTLVRWGVYYLLFTMILFSTNLSTQEFLYFQF